MTVILYRHVSGGTAETHEKKTSVRIVMALIRFEPGTSTSISQMYSYRTILLGVRLHTSASAFATDLTTMKLVDSKLYVKQSGLVTRTRTHYARRYFQKQAR